MSDTPTQPNPVDTPLNQNSGYRLAALIAALALPFINALLGKVGLSVTADQLVSAEVVAATFIVQSAVNAIHARQTQAKTAAQAAGLEAAKNPPAALGG